MDHKIVSPDQEDQNVDRQDPQHEDENRMCVVGKVVVSSGPLQAVSDCVQQVKGTLRFPRRATAPAHMLPTGRCKPPCRQTGMGWPSRPGAGEGRC
jgi:hypothetical protein